MVRLLTVRAAIGAWKRAIAISDKLKWRTWERLAITLAALAALSALAYYNQQTQPAEPSGERSAQNHSYIVSMGINERLDVDRLSEMPFLYVQTDADVIRAALREEESFRPASITVLQHKLEGYEWSRSVPKERVRFLHFAGHGSASTIKPFYFSAATSAFELRPPTIALRARDSYFAPSGGSNISVQALGPGAGDFFYLPQLPRFVPNAVYQVPAAESKSLIAEVQKLVLLCQAIILTIGSLFASFFGWIGYHRGKAEMRLKALQIRKAELELEQMEREAEKARREAAASGIVLVSR